MTLRNVFQVQGPFPNMESMAMLIEKTNKIGKNHKNKWEWCSLLVMMFGMLFSRSSVHLIEGKYGKS